MTAMRAARKPGLLLHVLGNALFFGGTAAVALLFAAGEASGAVHRAFALEVAAGLQDRVLLPGGLAIVASGVLLSLAGTGFVRQRWMVAKLVGSAILVFHSQVEFRPLTHRLLALAREAAAGAALPGDWDSTAFHFLRVAVIQLAVVALLSALGVFKPWGRTRFGRTGAAAKAGVAA